MICPKNAKERFLNLCLLEAKISPPGAEELVQWVKQLPSKSDDLNSEN